MADDDTLRREFVDVMESAATGHVSDATWEALALGELPAGERHALAAHVSACAECSDMYRTLRKLEDGARAFDSGVPSASHAVAPSRSAWYAIAASLLLVVAGYAGYRALQPPPSAEIAQSPEATPVMQLARIDVVPAEVQLSASRALTTRGASDVQRFLDDFGRAIAPYRNGQYAEAARLLADVTAKYPDAYEPVFYQGVAALLAEALPVANASLQRAAEIAPANLQDEIRWYRAAAFQRAGDVAQASALLRELCDGPQRMARPRLRDPPEDYAMSQLLIIALLVLQAGTAADLMAAAKARAETDRAGARELYERAATVCETAGDFGCAGRAYNELGLMAFFDGIGADVSRWYGRAAGAFERAGLIREQAMAIRGTTFDNTMSRDESLKAIDRAFEVASAIDDPALHGLLRHSRGDAMFGAGRYAESQRELEAALGLLEKAGAPGNIARVLTSLGRSFRMHGHPERALEQYQRAFALQQKVADLGGQSQTMNAIAIAQVALGNVDDAVRAGEQALVLARQSNAAGTIVQRTGSLARIYLLADRLADAERLYLQVLDRDEAAGGEYHLNLTEVQRRLGRPLEAIVTATQGIELATRQGIPEYVMNGHYDRAVGYEAAGRVPEALADAIRSVEILESLRAALVPEDALKQGFSDTHRKMYSALIRLFVKNGRHADALLAGERGRARAFLDLLATRSIGSETANAPTLLSRFRDPSEPLLRSFVAADPPLLDGITATAARLGSHILTYWVDPEAVTVCVISPAGTVHATRVNLTARRLDALVRATWQAQSESSVTTATRGAAAGRIQMDDSSRAAFRELYDLLVLPIRQWLPARGDTRLTIVPHGPLFRLSFAALMNERNQYLIEGYSVHYAPSVAVLQLTATHPRAASDATNVLIGDPDLRPSAGGEVLGRLPAARREVAGVAAAINTDRSLRLIGAPATEGRVRQVASSARVLHFATHGIVPDDQPFEAYLALGSDGVDPARDGRLTAREVYDLKLTADLVVLSGCRTARGQVTGDGVLGLSRAFLYAGTPSLMATLWDVYDDAGEHLLPSFYAEWKKGGDKAAALRQAQIALIRRLRAGAIKVATPAGDFIVPEHPAFWAGFVLVGEP